MNDQRLQTTIDTIAWLGAVQGVTTKRGGVNRAAIEKMRELEFYVARQSLA